MQIDLPPLGPRPITLLLFLFALLFGSAGFSLLTAALLHSAHGHPPAAVFFLFPLPFAAAGLLLLYVAVTQLLRRFSLSADPTGLTITSSILGLSRTRRFNAPALRDIITIVRPGSSDAFCQTDILGALDTGRRALLIRRYGATESLRLADALRAALFPNRTLTPDPAAPPPGGHLSLHTDGPTTRIHLAPEPAANIGHDSLATARFLLAASFLFPAIFISAAWAKSPGPAAWLFTLFALVLAIGMLTFSIALLRKTHRSADQQADITTNTQTQTLTIALSGGGAQSSPAHPLSWPATQLRDIAVAPSAYTLNQQPILELQITTTSSSTPIPLFTGRDPQDLHWLATALTRLLHLQSPEDRRATLFAATAPETQSVPPEYSGLRTQDSGLLAAIDASLQNTPIRRLPTPNALTLQFPGRAPLAPYIFAVVWLLVSSAILLATILSAAPAASIAFAAAFLLPGLYLLYHARTLNKSSASVTLTPDTLSLDWHVFRRGHASFPAADISALRVTPASDNSYQLTLDLNSGTAHSFLNTFPTPTLRALAKTLNLALGLTPS